MTNILAAIIVTVTTNWVTTSITSPLTQPNLAVDVSQIANQFGARVTNTVAVIVWNGKTNHFVLESTKPFYEGDLTRSVPVSMADRMKEYWNSK